MKKQEKILYFILAAIVWLYLAIRSWLVPFSYDEIVNFYFYVQSGNFIPFYSYTDANNHFLNSLFSWVAYSCFGSNQFVLRLPNLLSLVIFMLFSYKIVSNFKKGEYRLMLILALFFTHILIEWFGYFRGYGLMMAFLVMSIYYLIDLQIKPSFRSFLLCQTSLLLCLLANLSSIFFVVTVLLVLIYLVFKNRIFITSKLLLLLIWSLVLFGAINYLLLLNKVGALYLGSQSGLYETTLKSITSWIFGDEANIFLINSVTAFIGIHFILFLIEVVSAIRNRFNFKEGFFLSLIFYSCILCYPILNWLKGVNFPEDRAVIYLMPVLFISYTFMLNQLQFSYSKYLSFLLLLFPVSTARLYNFNTLSMNWYQYITVEEDFIKKAPKKINNRACILSGEKLLEPQYYWNNYKSQHSISSYQFTDYPSTIADFQYISIEKYHEIDSLYKIIDSSGNNNFYLVERQRKLNANLLIERNDLDDKYESEFINLFEASESELTEMKEKNIMITYAMKLGSINIPFDANIVITVFRNEEVIKYEKIPLNWVNDKYSLDQTYFFTIYINNFPSDATKFISYIWNVDRTSVILNESEVKIYELKDD